MMVDHAATDPLPMRGSVFCLFLCSARLRESNVNVAYIVNITRFVNFCCGAARDIGKRHGELLYSVQRSTVCSSTLTA